MKESLKRIELRHDYTYTGPVMVLTGSSPDYCRTLEEFGGLVPDARELDIVIYGVLLKKNMLHT